MMLDVCFAHTAMQTWKPIYDVQTVAWNEKEDQNPKDVTPDSLCSVLLSDSDNLIVKNGMKGCSSIQLIDILKHSILVLKIFGVFCSFLPITTFIIIFEFSIHEGKTTAHILKFHKVFEVLLILWTCSCSNFTTLPSRRFNEMVFFRRALSRFTLILSLTGHLKVQMNLLEI